LPDHALYGGSKIVLQYLIEALARDFGHRGVTVNSILPTAIKGVASTAGARSGSGVRAVEPPDYADGHAR